MHGAHASATLPPPPPRSATHPLLPLHRQPNVSHSLALLRVRPRCCTADVPLEEDVADLKAGPKEDVRTRAPDGEPIPIVPVSDVELEVMEACVTVQGEVPEAAKV